MPFGPVTHIDIAAAIAASTVTLDVEYTGELIGGPFDPGAPHITNAVTDIDWGDGSPHTTATVADWGLQYSNDGVPPWPRQIPAGASVHDYAAVGNYTISVNFNADTVFGGGVHLFNTHNVSITSLSAPPDPPDAAIEGAGQVKTYLTGSAASARMDADAHLSTLMAPAPPLLVINYAGFATDDYIIHSGIPNGRPQCEARVFTRVGIGAYEYSDIPPAPADVDTLATVRWLPTPDTFTPDGWVPVIGGGLTFITPPPGGPYLDTEYSFQVRGGDEVSLPAVIFSDDAWMKLDTSNWSAQAFTVVVVAVLHLNPEGPMYGVFESYTDPGPDGLVDARELATANTDWGVHYRQGSIELWGGGVIANHSVISSQARPVIIAAALDVDGGRLVVMDRNRSSRSFSTDTMNLYDTTLLLGRTGGALAPTQTAWMDVLEVDLYDTALSFDDIAEVVHRLDSCYGVVG